MQANKRGEVRWRGYLAAVGLGGSLKAGCARLCKRLSADTPNEARKKAGELLEQGKIDGAGYQTYIEAIDTVEEMYLKGEQTHVVTTNYNDWEPIRTPDGRTNGGHKRRNHL